MIVKHEGGLGGPLPATQGRVPDPDALPPLTGAELAGLDRTIQSTSRWLLDQQSRDGHWVGELEGDTILESEYILLLTFLGRERDPLVGKLARYLLEQQQGDGGWSSFPGGPADLSTTVKAYLALKLAGYDIDGPPLKAARELVLRMGGAHSCNSFTRFYLALLGQMDYDLCPTVPPELLFVPKRVGFSIYAMSSWTRTIVVPLMIISTLKPVRRLSAEQSIPELFREDGRLPIRRTPEAWSWTNFFLSVDRVLKWLDRNSPAVFRKPGLRAATKWMTAHFEGSDGLGAIFPPMIYTVIALRCLGHSEKSESVRVAIEHLEGLLIEEADSARVQPCVSPVWDTAIATIALSDAGLDRSHSSLRRAESWLLDKEVRAPGDWQVRCRKVQPSGWHFQYRNGFYPDIDDTAMVLLALHRTAGSKAKECREATARGVEWILAMQNRDGGWAAFDRDIDNQVLTKVPFADHNAMLDPSCADITARIIELLGTLGYRPEHPSIARALDYLWASQEPAGCWYGRWGVNYIYGTWQVLLGLRAIDFPMDHPACRRAVSWLESVQQADGGWGESCESYDDPSLKGMGETTPSQTAWAVAGLVAAGEAHSEAARRGVDYLVASQKSDGTWDEDAFTGTGFPRVFYLKYHLYRIYFPLMALGRFRSAVVDRSRLTMPAEVTEPLAENAGILAFGVPAQPRPFKV